MPKKGSNGHLWLRGRVYWAVWYRHGTRLYQNTHQTDRELAKAELTRLVSDFELKSVRNRPTEPPTVRALLRAVIEWYCLNQKRSIDLARRSAARLDRFLAGKRGDEVAGADIHEYRKARLAQDASRATINREVSLLRRAYNLALEEDQIKREHVPSFKGKFFTETTHRTGFFERADYEAVLRQLPDYLQGVLTLAYWTGMRKEEISGLRWDQVDLFSRVLNLEHDQTKTSEQRILPLDVPELWNVIEQQTMLHELFPTCELIFHRAGKPIGDFRKSWATARRLAAVGHKLFHDLRRTGVRNLVRSGVPESVAMLISGHKDRRVFERYNIRDARDLQEAMRKRAVMEEERRLEAARRVLPSFCVNSTLTKHDQEPESALVQVVSH